MKRLLAVLILLVLMPSLARALPPCPADQNERYHNCYGTYTTDDGKKYVGEWSDNKQHGHGTHTWADGDKYVGEYRNGKRNGPGTYTYADGAKFVGQYRNGKQHGPGTYTYADGAKFVGEYRNAKRNGHFTVTYPNGSKYVGEYRNDKKNGPGTRFRANGSVYQEGIFENGKFKFAQKLSSTQKQPTQTPSNFSLEKSEKKCAEIGFTKGTEKYGDCVMKLLN